MSATGKTPAPEVGQYLDLDVLHVFWLAGEGCDGWLVATLGASDPGVEDLLLGRVPDLPRVVLHHPVLAVEWGDEYVGELRATSAGVPRRNWSAKPGGRTAGVEERLYQWWHRRGSKSEASRTLEWRPMEAE